MYAVIETGGKQYRVQPGDILQVEKLEGEKGSQVKFDRVLLVSKPGADSSQVWLGKPLLSGASVSAEIVGQGRDEKILIIKMKRRKQYRRTQGHRQYQTQLLVTGLDNGAGEKATLSEADKKAKLASFHTNLKPKGPARTVARKFLPKKVEAPAAGTPAAEKKAAPKAGKKSETAQ